MVGLQPAKEESNELAKLEGRVPGSIWIGKDGAISIGVPTSVVVTIGGNGRVCNVYDGAPSEQGGQLEGIIVGDIHNHVPFLVLATTSIPRSGCLGTGPWLAPWSEVADEGVKDGEDGRRRFFVGLAPARRRDNGASDQACEAMPIAKRKVAVVTPPISLLILDNIERQAASDGVGIVEEGGNA